MGAKNRWSQGWTWRGNPTCPDTSIYKDHILFSMLRDDSSTTSRLLTRNCGSLIAITHAPDVPKRASWKIVVIRKQSLGRSPLGTAATHHNDVTTRSSIPIHVQQQISTGLPDNPWLMHYYYLISLLLFLLVLTHLGILP